MLTDTQITPVNASGRRDIRINPGDTIRVHQKITEKDKVRIQIFEGVVIACKHGTEAGATFTVRRVGSDAVAVEKIFPLYSPIIDKVEVVRRAKTRRARLYFLRDKTPKQIRDKLRRSHIVSEVSDEVGESEEVNEESTTQQEEVESQKEDSTPSEPVGVETEEGEDVESTHIDGASEDVEKDSKDAE